MEIYYRIDNGQMHSSEDLMKTKAKTLANSQCKPVQIFKVRRTDVVEPYDTIYPDKVIQAAYEKGRKEGKNET